jgi:hypothetical protein
MAALSARFGYVGFATDPAETRPSVSTCSMLRGPALRGLFSILGMVMRHVIDINAPTACVAFQACRTVLVCLGPESRP